MSHSKPRTAEASIQFWVIAIFLITVFVTGGSSRNDELLLAILHPISIAVCGIALSTLSVKHCRLNSSLVFGFGAVVIVVLVHVSPLPYSTWKSFFGSTELGSFQSLSDTGRAWRPLTSAPTNGWQAAVSLATPMAVFLLGIQLSKAEMLRLQPLLIGLASVSGLVGFLQITSDPSGPLYLYRITNNGSAVGLFANRNHAATLLGCLFPMLAVYASTGAQDQRAKQFLCGAIAAIIVPLILITGSRSGLVSAVIGLTGAALLYSNPNNQPESSDKVTAKTLFKNVVVGGLIVFALGLLTYTLSRAEAIDRFFLAASDQNRRADFFVISLDLFWNYFPTGTGSGSFAEIYQQSEPLRLLNPKRLNRAHNDLLEIAVTYGLPGLAGLTIFVGWYIRRAYLLCRYGDFSRPFVRVAGMAALAIAIVALASLSDYPLRTPIMMSFSVVLILWFANGYRVPPS